MIEKKENTVEPKIKSDHNINIKSITPSKEILVYEKTSCLPALFFSFPLLEVFID